MKGLASAVPYGEQAPWLLDIPGTTVRFSNFDHWDVKMGVFLQVQRRHPVDIFFNESLPPKTACGHNVHGRRGHGSPMKDC